MYYNIFISTSSIYIGLYILDIGKNNEHHSSNHPPFERSASTGDNPDFLDDDIDSFIATMMIPPPPDTVIPSNDNLSNSLQFQYDEEESQMYNGAESLISSDELLSSLVIPPPPGDASESIDEIKIVPPVETETNTSKHSNKSHRHYKHRRSSSLDVSSIHVFSDSQNEIESQTENSPKSCVHNVEPPKSLSHETDAQSAKDFESPATVSEKLNILLQSMPSFGSELSESDIKFRRTSSLRLGKSASFEVLASPITEEVTEAKKVGRSNSFQVHLQAKPQEQPSKKNGPTYISPKKNRPIEPAVKREVTASQEKSVQNSNYSRHLRRTHSFDIIPSKDDDKSTPEKPGGDNFASLKEKLKSYRDYLLSKSDKTKHRKSSLVSNDNASQNEPSSPLKRSNSFTFNWLKRRSNSFDSGDTSKISGSDSSLSNRPSESSKENEDSSNKKVPQVLNTLSVPRSTFKPHSSLSIQVRIHLSCHFKIYSNSNTCNTIQ